MTGPLFHYVDEDGDELVIVKTRSVDMYAVEILPGGDLSRVRAVDLPAADLRRLYDALRLHFEQALAVRDADRLGYSAVSTLADLRK